MAAGEGQDFGLGYSLAGGLDLPVLVGVLVAAPDVEADRAVQVAGDRGQIPASRVAAVLADEPGGVVHERRSVPPGDRRPQLGEFLRRGSVAAGVHARLHHRGGEHPGRALRPPHPQRAQRGAQ